MLVWGGDRENRPWGDGASYMPPVSPEIKGPRLPAAGHGGVP